MVVNIILGSKVIERNVPHIYSYKNIARFYHPDQTLPYTQIVIVHFIHFTTKIYLLLDLLFIVHELSNLQNDPIHLFDLSSFNLSTLQYF